MKHRKVEYFEDVPVESAQGLMRHALARGKSFRVLLRTEHDTIPVIVTFMTADSESWTVKSTRPLPGFLQDGLMGYLKVASQK